MEQFLFSAVCFPSNTTLSGQVVVKYFSFWPEFVFYLSGILSRLNGSLFVTLTSLFVVLAAYFYLDAVSLAIGVPRPPPYDPVRCNARPTALPDARFVVAIVYTVVLCFAIRIDYGVHVAFTRINALLLCISVILYLASTIISGYFTFELLGANLAIALVLAVAYWRLYRFVECAVENAHSKRVNNVVRFLKAVLGVSQNR